MILIRRTNSIPYQPDVNGVKWRILIGPGDGAPRFTMRLFEVPPGLSTPHHTHWWEHEVYVISGQGFVRTDDGDVSITAESVVFIPGGERHQFVNSGTEPLRFICVVPNKDIPHR